MNCPCCALALKAEDGPHVSCPHGNRFHVVISHADHGLTLKLVADPQQNAGMKLGHLFRRQTAPV